MTSDIGLALDTGSLALVGLLSLAAVAVVVLTVRALAPRRGWTADATAALTWSSSMAVVAVVCAVLWAFVLGERTFVTVYDTRTGAPPDPVLTLVWLPLVMALLWSVLHVLRSGTGHHSPLLGVPVVVAVPALWLVSAPLQVTVFTIGILGPLTWLGLVVWLLGQALVALGRSWLGDVAVWVGVALVAADAWPGYVGLVSPLVVAALVLFQRRRGATAPLS
ncbi:hypothetical protein [Nocardioides aurantiacus]|uniref:Uncharacterized protein n=1 Tax=Nocardioides aurantiacus TaxID=86796 RepID=A0A3N2CQ88_9ACTN|nr:hypothetical protein [Nocardioides aurantiacus]ROR89690.1 hypothetical protein EDD33_0519 [Nocardioides aurantiacus]